jgi:sugar transferase (PEP-CTERM/EpsH1 system associated)
VEDLLFLAHRIPYPPNKGDKIRSWNILKHLSTRYRVRLGCLIDDPHDEQYVAELQRHCAEVCAIAIDPRRQRIKAILAARPGLPLSARYFYAPALADWVQQTIDSYGIKRAFIFSTPMMASLPETPGLNAVLDLVDVDSEKWREMAGKAPFPKNIIYGREARTLLAYERAAAVRAQHAILASPDEAALFIARAPEVASRTSWMTNGVDLDYFSPIHVFPRPFADERPAIVFTGDMSYWPNVEAVVWFARDVLPALLSRTARPRFAIVGARPTPAVMGLAGEDVMVTGRVDDVRPYIAHAAAVVAPLLLARGLQNKVLEGMAMGKAVIATSAAEQGLDVRGKGGVLIADGPDAMAARVGETLDGVYVKIGDVARSIVEKQFAWPAVLKRLDALLEDSNLMDESTGR